MRPSWNSQRGVPEYCPLILLNLIGRVLVLLFENVHLGRRDAAATGRHLKLRRQVFAEYDPLTAALSRCKLLDHRLPVAERKLRSKLLPRFALPGKLDGVAAHFSFDSI